MSDDRRTCLNHRDNDVDALTAYPVYKTTASYLDEPQCCEDIAVL
jgi:hypothetical protein